MKLKKLLFVFSLSSLIFCCVPVELDNIEAFEYTFPGLEEVEPLPEVVLTVPAAVKVTDGKIVVPAKADELVVDVVASLADKNITQENLEVIKTFSQVAPAITSKEILETVTDNWIEGVLNGTVTPSANLIKIANDFANNPESKKYLSQLELPTVDGKIPGGRLYFPLDSYDQFVDNEVLKSFAEDVTCKAKAEEAYNANVKKLKAEADIQIGKSKVFYDGIRKVATDSYAKRIGDKDKVIDDTVDKLTLFMTDFNSSVDKLDYPDDVKKGLKVYIAAFVIKLRVQVADWNVAYTEAAKIARDKEIESATKEQAAADDKIKKVLKVALAEQTSLLQEAVNSCHNQGAGG